MDQSNGVSPGLCAFCLAELSKERLDLEARACSQQHAGYQRSLLWLQRLRDRLRVGRASAILPLARAGLNPEAPASASSTPD